MRNGAERREMLDRLMCGPVFAKSDGVMRENIYDLHFRQAGEPNRWPHVIRKAHERAAVRNQPAIERHASQCRAHCVLAHTKVNDAAVVTSGFKTAAVFDVG